MASCSVSCNGRILLLLMALLPAMLPAAAAAAPSSSATPPRTMTWAAQADEVTSLPGWDGALPSKQYSGYLPVGDGTRHLHYYYTESEAKPTTDSITLWLNGGPGASSIAYGSARHPQHTQSSWQRCAPMLDIVPASRQTAAL